MNNGLEEADPEQPPSNNINLPQNRFKTLIISNIAECYFRTYKKTNPERANELTQYDILEAERASFYTGDQKVVVTSLPINPDYLEDLKAILGYKTFLNLYPKNHTERICQDILKDKDLFNRLLQIIKENPEINLIPYYATEEFFDLVSTLKQKGLRFNTPETVSPKNRFIRDHYNCKVGFRKLWEKTSDDNDFVDIPEGFIVDDLPEALDATWWFYQNKKDFVIKYNRGVSGVGVVYYHCLDLPKEEKAFKKYLREKHQDRIWFEENFVVEEMIDVDKSFYGGSPSLEFKINGDVRFQYACVQRLGKDSYFEGVQISQEIEDQMDIDLERVVENCTQFGDALEEAGYRGTFDIDMVIDKKHNVYAVESNLRRTGGTHIFETAQYLFGKNFIKKTVVVSRDNLPISRKFKTYQDFKKVASKFYFSKETGEGIIPTITSFISTGKVGYIAFAKNLERIKSLEEKLEKAVN